MDLCKSKQISKQTTPTFQTCVYSNGLKNNISKFLSTQVMVIKVNESMKTMSYLPHYVPMLKQANFKTDHVHFSNCVCPKDLFWSIKQYRISSNTCQTSNKCLPLISAALLGIHIEISVSF